MRSRLGPVSEAVAAGGLVAGLGLLLLAAHLRHAADEVGGNLPAVFYGAIVPSIAALLVVVAGGWAARREWSDVSPWRFVAWGIGGSLVASVLSGMLIQYQLAEGVVPQDQPFVVAMFATYGAAVGLLVGRYDHSIKAAQARLSRERQRLDEFASIVSHDLRNPLGVAQGYVDLARETGEVEPLDQAAAAHDRMDAILRDTLSLARSGAAAVQPTPVDLGETARAAWTMVETGDASLRVEVEGTIEADRARLQTLFENLFRNAVQHNEGPVTVTVGPIEDGFYVEDTGQGIPSEHLDRVFETGYSTGDGTGLGLAIVRATTDAHGWSHRIASGRDGGARVEVTGVSSD